MNPDYKAFLASKSIRATERGLRSVPALAPHLFQFQSHCVDFALRSGCSGLFLDTGLGKTECQLEWCQKVIEATNRPALILTPLAVAWQTHRRAEQWGYEARVIRDQSGVGKRINICNYDRIDKLDVSAFGAVSLDEASILKSFTGKTTRSLINLFKGARFKLAATATPAPNDHMELGNYAEFLDVMAANEMLSRFFINDTSTASQEWRLKGHAVSSFWDWMASWARMAEKPSNLTGIEADDVSFILPPFETIRHRAKDSRIDRELADLFGAPAISAANMYDIKRQTSGERAKIAVQIINDEINRWLVQKSTEASMLKTDMPPIQHIEKIGERRQEREQNHKDFQAASNRLLEFQNKTTEPCFTSKTEDAPSAVPMSREDAEDGTSITVTTPIKFGDCSAIDATSALANSMKTRKLSGEQPTILKGERIPAWVLWCDTNDEQQTVERLLGDLCISIYGSQPADKKEELHEAWLNGVRPVLVTKPSIFGFGCDWNHCHNMIFLGRSFSYETWYQAVRRCWRFGQKRKVVVHLIVAEGETEIGRVIDRKAGDHARMKDAMRHAMLRATGRSAVVKEVYNPTQKAKVPEWLR